MELLGLPEGRICQQREIRQELTGDTWQFGVSPRQGSFAGAPESRNWQLEVYGITLPAGLNCQVGKKDFDAPWTYDEARHILRVDFGEVPAGSTIKLSLQGVLALQG